MTRKVGNGIVAITLQGKSGKAYWSYALSVIEKILSITVPEISQDASKSASEKLANEHGKYDAWMQKEH